MCTVSIRAHRAVVQGHTSQNVLLSGKFSTMVKMMSSDVDTRHMPIMHVTSLPNKFFGQHLKRREECLNEPVSLSSSQDNQVVYNSTTVFPVALIEFTLLSLVLGGLQKRFSFNL